MATVKKWGNSLAVRIPAGMASELQITAGSEVDVELNGGALVVTPKRSRYRLSDLLRDCRKDQLHGDTDFGLDIGREVID